MIKGHWKVKRVDGKAIIITEICFGRDTVYPLVGGISNAVDYEGESSDLLTSFNAVWTADGSYWSDISDKRDIVITDELQQGIDLEWTKFQLLS